MNRYTLILALFLSIFLLSGCGGKIDDEYRYDFDYIVYRDGIFYGKFSEIPFTGKVLGRGRYGSLVNGTLDGEWQYYSHLGLPREVANFNNGVLEGEWKRFYSNRRLWEEGSYESEKKTGNWNVYWRNGKLMQTGRYEAGKKIGNWIKYNQDGTINQKETLNYGEGQEIPIR